MWGWSLKNEKNVITEGIAPLLFTICSRRESASPSLFSREAICTAFASPRPVLSRFLPHRIEKIRAVECKKRNKAKQHACSSNTFGFFDYIDGPIISVSLHFREAGSFKKKNYHTIY
jgi:hypothetical protein